MIELASPRVGSNPRKTPSFLRQRKDLLSYPHHHSAHVSRRLAGDFACEWGKGGAEGAGALRQRTPPTHGIQCTMTWMELKGITLSKTNQSEKDPM